MAGRVFRLGWGAMLRAPRAVSWVTAVAVTLLTMPLVAGCSGGTTHRAAGPTTTPPTPIANLNTAQMVLHRIPFCDLLPRQAVTAALGGRPTATASWTNGRASRFVGSSGDHAQEFGCRYAAGSTVAEAWVFASPVDAALAQQVIDDARHRSGCRPSAAPAFGAPSELQTCRLSGGVTRVRHAGLFGDTWLTCQVAAALPERQVTDRAGAWCVQVANALNTSR